jgi:hypothetical protein
VVTVASSTASGREALATLRTTGCEDGATRTGAHPKTEAVLLVPTQVVRLERPLAHWNDSGYSRSHLSTNPLIDLSLVLGPAHRSRNRQIHRPRRERSTKRPAQHRLIHGTWRPVDRSNQPSPYFSTGPVDERALRSLVTARSRPLQTATDRAASNTTTLRRLPDTPQVAPNFSPIACG